jgi:hypothetical protein
MKRACFIASLVVASCGGSSAKVQTDATPAASFIDVQLVLNGAGCTESGCHGNDKKGGLNLADDAWTALVNVPAHSCKDGRKLVVPGKPNSSYLLNKLRGTELCNGERMPKGCGQGGADQCLSDERLATLESWIRGGATME